jgi:hypothetical protein
MSRMQSLIEEAGVLATLISSITRSLFRGGILLAASCHRACVNGGL